MAGISKDQIDEAIMIPPSKLMKKTLYFSLIFFLNKKIIAEPKHVAKKIKQIPKIAYVVLLIFPSFEFSTYTI